MNEQTIFTAAIEREPAERSAFLDGVCGANKELRERVEKLIGLQANAGNFLEQPAAGASPTLDQPLLERPGTLIGPYKLLQQIGEGGMGTVYMAEQTEPVERKVALKVIKAGMDTQQVIARFEAERQALAMMDHVNIARVLDVGTTQSGRPFFVMELVHGVPITQYCDDQRLNPRQRLELFVPVCQAIQHAHQKGIIHRDIKPTNVMVTLYDGKPVPKVIDFGVAKATEQKLTERTLFTQYGTLVGTLEYMSPEQAEMSALGADTRSDIFSLGVLLYELLTGSTPLSHKRLKEAAYGEVLRMIREEEAPKPSTRLSDSGEALASISANRHTEPAKLTKLMRGELDWIVMKTLEKDRSRRYETAKDFAVDVQRYLADEPVQACPPSAWYKFRKFARRNKRALVSGAVLAVAVLIVAGTIGWAVRDRDAHAQEAARERAARQMAVELEVNLALKEAEQWQEQAKWQEALSAAKRAQGLLAGSGSDELRGRVHQLRRDFEMVLRLEDIPPLSSEIKENKFDWESADRAYAQAFADYGIDVASLPADEAAARIRARSRVAVTLAAALDDWAINNRGQKDNAGGLALKALAQATDPNPWRRQVRQALKVKDTKALAALAASPELLRQPPTSFLILSSALNASGLVEAQIEVLRRAQWQYPGDFRINYGLGAALRTTEPPDRDEAISFLRVALAVRPRSTAAHITLGNALRERGKLDEAIACYRKWIEVDPKDSEAHIQLGVTFERQGNPDEAIAVYRQGLERLPDEARLHGQLAHVLWKQRRLEEAAASFRQAIKLGAGSYYYYWLGYLLNEQQKPQEAVDAFRKAIDINPKFTLAHHQLGLTLMRLGEFAESIACYRKAIEVDPKDVQAYISLGSALRAQKKLDDAVACYKQAIELDPKGVWAHYELGITLRDQKKPDEAIAELRQAVTLEKEIAAASPHLRGHQNSLAHLLNDRAWQLVTAGDPKSRDPERAIELAQEAAALSPNYAACRITLGVAHYRAGNWKAAALALEQFLQHNPAYSKDSAILFYLSMAHGRLNEPEQARTFYDQAAQWRMGIGVAEEELRRLCAEAAALLGLEVPPTLQEPPVLTPGPPLLEPAAGATLDNGTVGGSKLMVREFDWSDVSGATQYHLYVTGPIAALWVISNPTLTSSSYRYEAKGYLPDQFRLGWRWKVRALVHGTWTDWSEERSFEVAPLDDNKPASPKK